MRIDAIFGFLTLPSRAHQILGINARNRGLVYAHNKRSEYPFADDKLLTKQVLESAGVPIPRTLAIFSGMHEARLVEQRLGHLDDFVVKPAQGSGGTGILVLVGRDDRGWLDADGEPWTAESVGRHISNIVFGNYAHGMSDRALVEERLLQGPLLGDVRFPGMPDIRVITLRATPVMAMLRLPTRQSHGKANLHQGAVGVGVDLRTGLARYASFRGTNVKLHPDTGTSLVGSTVSGWPAIVEVARRAAAAIPLGYLGIDIAIDARVGPVVLEVNARPGLEIQNANRMGLRAAVGAIKLEEESA